MNESPNHPSVDECEPSTRDEQRSGSRAGDTGAVSQGEVHGSARPEASQEEPAETGVPDSSVEEGPAVRGPDESAAEPASDQETAGRHTNLSLADEELPPPNEGEADPELTTQQVIEAVLFATDSPLPMSRIVSILGIGSARDVKKHIEALNERYEAEGAAFRIENIAGGYQMLTLPVYNTWLRRLKQNRQDSRLSPAALETLAVVAYKQPVVRAEIEAIRGVAAGEMLNRLRELGLVKIVGRAEDVGRPMLYGTTKRFLEVFGLSNLEDLPPVEQLQAPE